MLLHLKHQIRLRAVAERLRAVAEEELDRIVRIRRWRWSDGTQYESVAGGSNDRGRRPRQRLDERVLLDVDRSDHARMNRAVVLERAGRRERSREGRSGSDRAGVPGAAVRR